MKETNIYDYYCFGFNYHLWKQGFTGEQNSFVKSALEEYIENISELELQVTAQITEDLEDIANSIENDSKTIDAETAKRIESIIDRADSALDAELQLKKVLIVTPKRFNQEMLLKHPEKLLAKGAALHMSDNAKLDFSSATRCIAMNLSTAAAFHLMRCVEEMVKQLYYSFVKQNRMDKPMWGPILTKLKNKNRPKPNAELIDHLDIIRKNFRNPTQHPEKFYSIDEAQDLLNSSIVAINMISSVLKERC